LDARGGTDIPIRVRRALLALAGQAGVGKEDIDGTVFGFGRCDQRLDIGLLANIDGDREAVDVTCDIGQPLARVPEVGDHDAAGASRGVGARDRLADSARRTGDDTDFVFDLHSRLLVLTRSFSFGSMN